MFSKKVLKTGEMLIMLIMLIFLGTLGWDGMGVPRGGVPRFPKRLT